MKASRLTQIAKELKRHAPFTAFGALTGIIILSVISIAELSPDISHKSFHIFHPAHVVLSSLVTTAMYRRYGGSTWAAVPVGFVGSVGICSISDVVLPYLGGTLLGATVTFHVCFIEHPLLITSSAFAGIAIGLLRPWTRVPHAGHVLLSTWASLFYLIAFGEADWISLFPFVFLVLFVAVWIPCCMSDIAFPILFTKRPSTTNP